MICNECETVAHCSKNGCIPKQPAPVQDSTCNETLRAQGKAYPRTCRKCGLGPCIGAPKQPPEQPATEESSAVQPAPVQEPDHPFCDCGQKPHEMHLGWCAHAKSKVEWAGVAQKARYRAYIEAEWLKLNPPAQEFVCSTGLCYYKRQRQWIGLTDEEMNEIWADQKRTGESITRAIEAKLKEKNT
jgi:hypothetical protein